MQQNSTPQALTSGSRYPHLHHQLQLCSGPLWAWASTTACTGHTGNQKNTQEIPVSLCGPFVGWKQLSGAWVSLDYVLNKPPFEPQKGQEGWATGASFVWTLESFLGSFSLLPTPRSFPLPNSFFKNVSCCFYNSACVWADVQESSLNKGDSEDRGVKILHFSSVLILPNPGFPRPAFNSPWLIISSSFSPWDSTCLPIEQHVFCEATWEQSHWALGLTLGSFERGKKNGPKGACDGGRPNRSKATREPNAIRFCDKQGTGSRNTTEGQGSQNGPGLAMSLHTFFSPLSLPEWEKQPQEIPKGHIYFEPMKRDYPSTFSGMHISFPCLPCETLPITGGYKEIQQDSTTIHWAPSRFQTHGSDRISKNPQESKLLLLTPRHEDWHADILDALWGFP